MVIKPSNQCSYQDIIVSWQESLTLAGWFTVDSITICGIII